MLQAAEMAQKLVLHKFQIDPNLFLNESKKRTSLEQPKSP